MADADDIDENDEVASASELDDKTHRELGLVYEESAKTILFTKSVQWKTVASTLVAFLVFVALARFISHAEAFMTVLKFAVIFTSMAAILLLFIFQSWQHTESKKIAAIEKQFSSVFRNVRGEKSKLEANIHRYMILAMMIGAILLGGYLTITSLEFIK